MYDHIGIRVAHLNASVRFYTAALAPLGLVLTSRDDASASFGRADSPILWLLQDGDHPSRGAHLALRADAPAAVDRFHAAGIKAGGKDNGKAGPRPDYSPTYYAAFLLDPDGNNVEAVRT